MANDDYAMMIDPAIEARAQSRALGLIQTELGVAYTNFFTMQARVEELLKKGNSDQEMIQALQGRIHQLEQENQTLKDSVSRADG